MEYKQKIITSNNPSGLSSKIKEAIADGWEAIGSHTAVQLHAQLRYSGNQHMETEHRAEYAQTVRKKLKIYERINRNVLPRKWFRQRV